MGWATNPTRKQESLFTIPIIQMGARVYLPTLGRFLQVDPIEGGTLNPYVYAHDPVNLDDYSGERLSFRSLMNTFRFIASPTVASRKPVQKAANSCRKDVVGCLLVSMLVVGTVLLVASPIPGDELAAGAGTAGAVSRLLQPASNATQSAYQKGLSGINSAGVVQNTSRIPSLSGTANYRIPDFIYRSGGQISTIGEVKNVQYQGFTSQIRDSVLYSQQYNINFTLTINSGARLSGPLMSEVQSGNINLIRY